MYLFSDSPSIVPGLFKPGGTKAASQAELLQCVQSARLRHKEVLELLQQSVEELRRHGREKMEE